MIDPTQYMDSIRSISYRVAWNSESFQEMKSEMCLALCEMEDNGDDEGLLLTKAKRRAIDHLRSRKFCHSWRNEVPHLHLRISSRNGGPEYAIANPITGESVIPEKLVYDGFEDEVDDKINAEIMVDSLSEKRDRTIIRMWMENYKQREIAHIVGTSRSMVSRRISSIKKQLQARYNVNGGSNGSSS